MPRTKITTNKAKPYTKITYTPDYSRFNTTGISGDMFKIMEKRAYDMGAITGSMVNVYFNGKKIECKTFEKYIDLYIGNKKESPRIYERIGSRWEIAATLSPELEYDQISFVNGIYTSIGGKHINYITDQVNNFIYEYIKKKYKGINIREAYIRDRYMIFIKATIENPTFSSQTKEEMTSSAEKFDENLINKNSNHFKSGPELMNMFFDLN